MSKWVIDSQPQRLGRYFRELFEFRRLLLTFTRRAAAEMTRRARHICAAALQDRARSRGKTRGSGHPIRITWTLCAYG